MVEMGCIMCVSMCEIWERAGGRQIILYGFDELCRFWEYGYIIFAPDVGWDRRIIQI